MRIWKAIAGPGIWLPALMLLFDPTFAHAQLSCDVSDELCTGDPCEIRNVLVDDSCHLDFGSRHVLIRGRLRIPNSGELSILAASIALEGRIENVRASGPIGAGPQVSLIASGDLDFSRGRIRFRGERGEEVPGSLLLEAGGSLSVRGGISTHTSPTNLVFRTGTGNIAFSGRARSIKADGHAVFESAGDVTIDGSLSRFDHIDITAQGDVDWMRRNTPRKTLTLNAGGMATLGAPIRRDHAVIRVRGDAGVVIEKFVKLVSLFVFEGTAEFTSANGPVTINGTVHAVDLDVTAGGDIHVNATLSARPPTRSGGTIDLVSTGGNIFVDGWLRAQSGDGVAPGDGAGGQIRIEAAQHVSVTDDISFNAFPGKAGAPGGTLDIEAAAISVVNSKFDADGDAPGPEFPGSDAGHMRLVSTTGDIEMDGTFEARGGATVIQADSAGDLVARGKFLAAPDGCIGLSAVGTTDTTGATFDLPAIANCP